MAVFSFVNYSYFYAGCDMIVAAPAAVAFTILAQGVPFFIFVFSGFFFTAFACLLGFNLGNTRGQAPFGGLAILGFIPFVKRISAPTYFTLQRVSPKDSLLY